MSPVPGSFWIFTPDISSGKLAHNESAGCMVQITIIPVVFNSWDNRFGLTRKLVLASDADPESHFSVLGWR